MNSDLEEWMRWHLCEDYLVILKSGGGVGEVIKRAGFEIWVIFAPELGTVRLDVSQVRRPTTTEILVSQYHARGETWNT